MKRVELINKLIGEGLSKDTLVKLSDKHVEELHERFFGEASQKLVKQTTYTPSEVKASQVAGRGVKVDGGEVMINKDGGMTVTHSDMKEEELTALQKDKLDKNNNDKIDSEDFKLLRKEKNKKAHVAEENKEINEWLDKLTEKKYHPAVTKNEIVQLINEKLKTSK